MTSDEPKMVAAQYHLKKALAEEGKNIDQLMSEIQRGDKKLTCKDLILEINEAEHYREMAYDVKAVDVGNTLNPWCASAEYTRGSKAVESAEARINYLGNIYDLLECGRARPARQQPIAQPVAPPPQVAPPSRPRPQYSAPAQPTPGTSGEPQGTFYGAVPGFSGIPYYRSLKGFKNITDVELHEHEDKARQPYLHSHPHNGAHWHAEDVLPK